MLLLAWLPMALITALHYSTGDHHHWAHDVLRRLYYLPIILAAFFSGLRGGIVLSVSVAVAYSPHAFTHLMHMDPAHTLEKVLELALYLVVGSVTGLLVDRERRRQLQLHEALGRLQASLEEQRSMGEQLVRSGRLAALGELVAGIAHEIKNPLHALQGTAEVVDVAVAEDAPQRRMWELHLKEIERLGAVAERFLSFARPTPLEPVQVDLVQIVERTRELVAAQAHKQEVVLELEPPPKGDRVVRADAQQLSQVLLNICLNALQAMEGGGTIRLAVGATRRGNADYKSITVENDGQPIEGDNLERIFDPFVTTKSEGVGLGLSIASRIVEQHGGFIEVRNLEGGAGVAFEVLLPDAVE
jgi:signal transduction histidine kinase